MSDAMGGEARVCGRALAGVALLLASCAGGDSWKVDRTTPPPVTVAGRALLVGVSEYAAEDLRDLSGPANDVRLMRDLLVHRFGFRPEDVRLLENEEATYNGIVEAVDELLRSVTQDELALLYFSGHGSQVGDDNGDERADGTADRFDETFVPHDARVENVPDVTDDMLASMLAFHEKRAVVILDCCHSGSGTRMGVVARGAERDTRSDRESIYAEQRAFVAKRGEGPDLGATRLVRSVDIDRPHLLLAASSSRQLAIEADLGSTRHGIFTYALCRALAETDPGTSIADLMRGPVTRQLIGVKERLGLDELPNPQLEGPAEYKSQALFRGAQQARLAWSPVRDEGDGRVRVDCAALVASVRPGAVLAIYPPDTLDFAAAQMLALATVEARDGDELFARLEATAPLPAESRAVLLLEAPPGPVEVQLADDEARARLAGLAGELADSVVLREEPPTEGFLVSRVSGEDAAGWDVLRSDGVPLALATGDDAEVQTDLARLFRRFAELDGLLSLENVASPLELEVWLEQVAPAPEGAKARGLEFLLDVPVYNGFREQDKPTRKNGLYMAMRANGPCYITLIEIDAAGEVFLMWPPDAETAACFDVDGTGRMASGSPLRIPEDEKAGFRISCGTPYGLGTVVAVAASDLELAGEVRAFVAEHGVSGTGNVRSAVAGLRAQLALRGLEGADWDVASVTFRVDPPKD